MCRAALRHREHGDAAAFDEVDELMDSPQTCACLCR